MPARPTVKRADAVGDHIFIDGNECGGARLRLWRRHRRRLVSDHAFDLAGRSLHALSAGATASIRRPAKTNSRSSRQRTKWPPSAW